MAGLAPLPGAVSVGAIHGARAAHEIHSSQSQEVSKTNLCFESIHMLTHYSDAELLLHKVSFRKLEAEHQRKLANATL